MRDHQRGDGPRRRVAIADSGTCALAVAAARLLRLRRDGGDRRRRGLCALAAGTRSRRSAVGIGLPGRIGLQHHAILVRLAEDGGDLPLAERVVQRVLDRLHRHAQPHRRVAVDGDERCGSPRSAWSDATSRSAGRLRHRGPQPRRPARQLAARRCPSACTGTAVRLTRVPILMSCTGWKNAVNPGMPVIARLQPGDHHRRRIALPHRLQRDGQPPGVRRGVDRAGADERHHAGHRRVLGDALRRRRSATPAAGGSRRSAPPRSPPAARRYPAAAGNPWAR